MPVAPTAAVAALHLKACWHARLASAEPSEALVDNATPAPLMDQAAVEVGVCVDMHAVEAIPPVAQACCVVVAVPSMAATLVNVACISDPRITSMIVIAACPRSGFELDT